MPAPDGPQFRNLWAAAIEETGLSLSDEELDDVRRAMPEGAEPTAENFERGHRLANTSLPLDSDEAIRRATISNATRGMTSDQMIEWAYAHEVEIDDTIDEFSAVTQQFTTSDMTDMQGRTFRPNYDEPDPFDRSDPEQARQAKAIEDMNEALEE